MLMTTNSDGSRFSPATAIIEIMLKGVKQTPSVKKKIAECRKLIDEQDAQVEQARAHASKKPDPKSLVEKEAQAFRDLMDLKEWFLTIASQGDGSLLISTNAGSFTVCEGSYEYLMQRLREEAQKKEDKR